MVKDFDLVLKVDSWNLKLRGWIRIKGRIWRYIVGYKKGVFGGSGDTCLERWKRGSLKLKRKGVVGRFVYRVGVV